MDKGYEKEKFETIKIKTSVAKRFRNYCRTISKSKSMTTKSILIILEKVIMFNMSKSLKIVQIKLKEVDQYWYK
ncbi:BfmA/BtgA family mobilization protein [Confluentibacter flavum]|uniref:Uncharacterized protein n=1 Tax=Confluentibacter flavum TaxID=1909700 RepID=A0A2N3HM77_9FLAO|nr:BfmA/BtgA family mobilization protein [Confluentibacter flavum]PKQ45948.1 hypothetical protein CSW08_05885 [Confluentibacter flavum]